MSSATTLVLADSGSSIPEAQRAYDLFEGAVRQRFPLATVRRGCVSARALRRRRMGDETDDGGRATESVVSLLQRLRDEGVSCVALQTLHITAGAEFHRFLRDVAPFRSGPAAFDHLGVGRPLLVSHADLTRVVAGVRASLPQLDEDEAVVFMAHGNRSGQGDMAMLATAAAFRTADPRLIFGTLEGSPSLADVLVALRSRSPRHLFLVPFMAAAGYHARHDLAGDAPESWKSLITATGITCTPLMSGLTACRAVTEVWLDHLAAVLAPACQHDETAA